MKHFDFKIVKAYYGPANVSIIYVPLETETKFAEVSDDKQLKTDLHILRISEVWDLLTLGLKTQFSSLLLQVKIKIRDLMKPTLKSNAAQMTNSKVQLQSNLHS